MSNCVNQVFLLGAAGKDPEFRTTAGGTMISTFTLATNESRKDAQGNWKEETTWHNLKMFGRLAEIAREQVTKGAKVFIEGKLTVESWDDKQTGAKRSKTVIVATYLSVVPTARSVGAGQPTVDGQRPITPRDHIEQATEITDADISF